MIILKRWIKEFLSFFVFLRFKDVWALYRYLLSKNKDSGLCASVFYHYIDRQGGYIGIGAHFASTPYFPHGLHGVFISPRSVIGKNAVIFQGVTIGANRTAGSSRVGNPVIGDHCYIGAGAKIIGGIRIGNNCRIGANAVVCKDLPDNSVAVCAPTRIITRETPPDNRFYLLRNDGRVAFWDGQGFRTVEDEGGCPCSDGERNDRA